MPIVNIINQSGTKDKRRFVDAKFLLRQAAFVGKEVDRLRLTGKKTDLKLAEGVWEMLHIILDDLEKGGECILELPSKRED